MRKRLVIGWLLLLTVSVIGFGVSKYLNAFVFDEFDAYGEVPIPGTRTLHLPAGDVRVSFHSLHVAPDDALPIPQDLKVTITPPSGVAEPNLTEDSHNTTNDSGDAHRSWRVAHISQAGDYTITTNGQVTRFVSPRLSFGHPSRFGFLTRLFVGLFVVSLAALLLTATAPLPRRSQDSRVERFKNLLDEAGVSRARRRTTYVVGQTLWALAAVGIVVFFAGVVVNEDPVWIGGLALFGGSVVLMYSVVRAMFRRIEKVRWQEGTVTFRTVERKEDSEGGQWIDCEVELNPTGRITQVSSTSRDIQRVVVGWTRRCLIDRMEWQVVAFPDAAPDAPLPSGKKLRFYERKSPR